MSSTSRSHRRGRGSVSVLVVVMVLALVAPASGAERTQQMSTAQTQAEARAQTTSAHVAGYRALRFNVYGAYIPLSGDFDGDGGTGSNDILWYVPGPAPDPHWDVTVTSSGFTHTQQMRSVTGDYWPFVHDFDDDGADDIFWYAPGSAKDFVWYGGASGFTSVETNVHGDYLPVATWVDGVPAIFWYAPGGVSEQLWLANGRSFVPAATGQVLGDYWPAPIESHTGEPGILFYSPGSGPDYVWSDVNVGAPPDSSVKTSPINGLYEPVAQYPDVILYGLGTDADYIAHGGGAWSTEPITINGEYLPGASHPEGNVVWHAAGPDYDYLWSLEPPM